MSDQSQKPVISYCCAYKGKEACRLRQQCVLFSEYFRIAGEKKLSAVNGFQERAPYSIVKNEHSCYYFQSK